MPRPPSPLPAGLPESFSLPQARAYSVSRQRLLASDLETRFRGARIRTRPASQTGSAASGTTGEHETARAIRAYLPVLPAHAFFCGPTAAWLWGIPLPGRIDATLHIGAHRPRAAPSRPGVRGRQFTPGFVRVVEQGGIPVTDPASTWATLGGILNEKELVIAADRMLRAPREADGRRDAAGEALASRGELAVFAGQRGRPGAPVLRRALDRARTGASSPPETLLRLLLEDAGLPEPVLDHDVHDDSGRLLGCSALAYPERRVAVEYEDDGHLGRVPAPRGIDRGQLYAEAGWTLVRLAGEHLHADPREAVRRVRRALSDAP